MTWSGFSESSPDDAISGAGHFLGDMRGPADAAIQVFLCEAVLVFSSQGPRSRLLALAMRAGTDARESNVAAVSAVRIADLADGRARPRLGSGKLESMVTGP
jgi:hypothetical protein